MAGTAAALGAWVAEAGALPGERALLIGLHAATSGPVGRAAAVTSDLSDLMPLTVVAAGVLAALLSGAGAKTRHCSCPRWQSSGP